MESLLIYLQLVFFFNIYFFIYLFVYALLAGLLNCNGRVIPICWPNPSLVQEICQDGCHLVAKQPKGQNLPEQEKGFLWRYSFSAAEKKLFRQGGHDEASSCRKQVLRIMKALREELNLEPLKSYHLKTILLYECEANPLPSQWSYTRLGERFMGLIQRLENCLVENNCPHYFIPHLNLFETFPLQSCEDLVRKVRGIRLQPREVFISLIFQSLQQAMQQAIEQSGMQTLEQGIDQALEQALQQGSIHRLEQALGKALGQALAQALRQFQGQIQKQSLDQALEALRQDLGVQIKALCQDLVQKRTRDLTQVVEQALGQEQEQALKQVWEQAFLQGQEQALVKVLGQALGKALGQAVGKF